MRYACFSICILWVLAASAKADQFCFALAETYYEQVYCQLQAKAQTKGLPPFNQFRKNNEAVQASLLKWPAERNGIKLPAVVHKASASQVAVGPTILKDRSAAGSSPSTADEPTSGTKAPKTVVHEPALSVANSALDSAECTLVANQIRCATQLFKLVGNKANQRLEKNVLSTDNKMNLPKYSNEKVGTYLAQAYGQYIDKMCDIGLCGVTMTYRKFAYLYQDLLSKGLDFPQRFELMYSFLKKDKATMGVSEAVSIPKGASLQDCVRLTSEQYICDYQSRNYIFELQ